MAVWLIRAGGYGEDEDKALGHGLSIIGFKDIGNLSAFQSVEDIAESLRVVDKEHRENRATNQARQLWAFFSYATEGDMVVMPLKSQKGQIALGRIAGPYKYENVNGENRHTRKVKWVRTDVSKSNFKQDLLYSFGAFLTVCRIRRNDAERRVEVVLNGGMDPGFSESDKDPNDIEVAEILDTSEFENHEEAAQNEVLAHIREKFKAHDYARLVEAVLKADGYITHLSPPGPDGGVDILAGKGFMGLDGPTLCVQVKATVAAADVKVFRELIGTMESFKANQGLLVCQGGFTPPLLKEARQHVFRVRLWNESDLVEAIYKMYEKLSPEIQAELPLKKVWMLVKEENA